ncbi:MAG TPA: class I SAM-dependent methyltransferase [Nitrospirota bacterium]|nr:class I SAM-dependent methyltransferase [Nitrospirota bacterium]
MKFNKFIRILGQPSNRYATFKRLKEYHSQPRTLEDTVYWAMNFGGRGYYKVYTIQKPSEILALAKAVQAIKPKVILEIGTARGGTLFIWSQIASDEVISCDIDDLSIQSKILKAFPPPNSMCRVSLLTGNSHDAEFKKRIVNRLGGRKVDFLFIDGDHTEAGVTADYNDYKDFVGPGGIIAFHDIVKEQPLESNQVFHLWERIKQGAETVEFVEDPKQCGFGIGIVRIQR